MKKFIVILTIITIFLNIIVGCSNSPEKNNKNIQLKLVIQKESSPTYLFELQKNGELLVYKGSAFSFDMELDKLIDTQKKESIILSNQKIDKIGVLLNNLTLSKNEETVVDDFWECLISYNIKSGWFSYGKAKNKNCDLLVSTLLEYSPIKIIDYEGFEAKPYTETE